MLEVVFSDSMKGSMKVAQHDNKKEMVGGNIAYLGEKPSQKELETVFSGYAIGGTSQNVCRVAFCLDIGEIAQANGMDMQRKVLLEQMMHNSEEEQEKQKERVEAYWKSFQTDFEKLMETAKKGGPIRVWYGDAPYSLCGFYFVCSVLKDYDCTLYEIKLPKIVKKDDCIVSYSGWEEVPPGQLYQFLSYERKVSPAERRYYADEWETLKKQNASLRAMVNGKLMSVPEDFYDHLIRKEIPDGEFRLGWLIANILGKYPIGVGDWWYHCRIKKMIQMGEIEVLSDEEKDYRKILMRNTNGKRR